MSEKIIDAVDNKQLDELSEDMEMIGPGQILSEAREKASLTVEHIANRLNFKVKLVECIEQDIFNPKLPATYNRGYLRSYARLVNVDVSEVLSAYDMLDVAKVQRSEMQSFSKRCLKAAPVWGRVRQEDLVTHISRPVPIWLRELQFFGRPRITWV